MGEGQEKMKESEPLFGTNDTKSCLLDRGKPITSTLLGVASERFPEFLFIAYPTICIAHT